MNQQPKNPRFDENKTREQKTISDPQPSENDQPTFTNSGREANPLYSDSVLPSNTEEALIENQRDGQTKNEPKANTDER